LDLGIADAFDCVIAVEDVVNPKPHAEPYQLAAERLGLSATRCVAFEDSPSGVKAGAAAGMVVIAVRTGHSTEELTAAGATVVVDDFTAPRVRETLERYCS
jgi:beta-phosphoglucomutase-like phosphatase (HAD superfamily)